MFQGTKIVKFLFYSNVIIFLITALLSALNFNLAPLILWNYNSELFLPHQLITYQFLHGGLLHLFFNMLVLISLVPDVENYLDSKKFLIYYLVCGIFAGLFNSFVTDDQHPMVGASGSIWGMIVMFALIYPNTKLSLFFLPFGIKAKWLILALASSELLLSLGTNTDGVAHVAHLGGCLMGLALFLFEKYIAKNPN